MLSVIRVEGERFKLHAEAPDVYTSCETHRPEKAFINTQTWWPACPCKRRETDLECVSKTFETSDRFKQS